MKRIKSDLPKHDYGLALKKAVSWLGDRYLLAEPMSRRGDARKPFFVEPRSWHDAQRRNSVGKRKH